MNESLKQGDETDSRLKNKTVKKQKSQKRKQKSNITTKKREEDEDEEDSKFDITNVMDVQRFDVERKRKLRNLEELCSLKAQEAFEHIFQFSPKMTMTDINNNIQELKNAREWWEHTGPQSQCKNVIGKWESTESCYICGLPFEKDDLESNPPECEHILPVYQAALLLTLYSSKIQKFYNTQTGKIYDTKLMSILKNPTSAFERAIKQDLEQEYAWAHRCCNQIKSDDSFLTFDKDFKHDVSNMTEIISSIYDGKRQNRLSYCDEISEKIKEQCKKQNKKRAEWIRERMDIINSERIKPICNRLNESLSKKTTEGLSTEGLYYLGLLANIMSAANSVYVNLATYGNTKMVAKAPITESFLKLKVFTEITENIANGIESSEINKLDNKFVIDLTLNNILYSNGNPTQSKVTSITDTSGRIIYKKYQKFIHDLLISRIGKQNITLGTTDYVFTGILRDMMILIKQVIPESEKNESKVEDMACECFKISIYSYFLYSINEFFQEKYEKVFGMNPDKLTERQKTLMNNLSIFKVQIIEKIKSLINNCLDNIKTDGKDQYKPIIKMLIHVLQNNNLNANIDITDIIASYDGSIIKVDISTYIEKDNMMEKRVEYYEKYTNKEDIYENEEELEADISKLEFSAIQTLTSLKKSETLLQEIQEIDPKYVEELKKEATEEQIASEKEKTEAQEYIKEAAEALSALKTDVTGSPITRREEGILQKRTREKTALDEVEAATALVGLTRPPLPPQRSRSQQSIQQSIQPRSQQSIQSKRIRMKGGKPPKRKTRKIRRNNLHRF